MLKNKRERGLKKEKLNDALEIIGGIILLPATFISVYFLFWLLLG